VGRAYYAPVPPTRVLAQRFTPAYVTTTTATAGVGVLAGSRPTATAPHRTSAPTAGQPGTSLPGVRQPKPVPPSGRQHVTGQPVGAPVHRAVAASLGAVPLLTALLLIEALILGRRLGQRARRGRMLRPGFAMA
jgi:hypothetical protein